MPSLVDRAIGLAVERTIRRARRLPGRRFTPGEPLRILLIGYSGKRNLGAEVRGAEIVRMLRESPLGRDLQVGVLTLSPGASRDFYPPEVELVPMSSLFFEDLLAACGDFHAGVLAEGSCLTAVTSNVAALFFIGAAGILAAQGKPCVGFGVEAGPMAPWLERMARRYGGEALFAARTEVSLARFRELGCRAVEGTDTAWEVSPRPGAWAARELRERWGWDGRAPIIGVSAMNPFIRPIHASLGKYLRAALTGDRRDQYEKLYFYTTSPERERLFAAYLDALAGAASAVRRATGGVPALVVMEPMDRPVARLLRDRLPGDAMVLSAEDYDGVQMAALLGRLALLLTSRYHAHVLSIWAGVPTVAVSKDQRLTALFAEHGQGELCLSTHDPGLGERLPAAALDCWRRRAEVQQALLAALPRYRARQQRMRDRLVGFLAERLEAAPPARPGPVPARARGAQQGHGP